MMVSVRGLASLTTKRAVGIGRSQFSTGGAR